MDWQSFVWGWFAGWGALIAFVIIAAAVGSWRNRPYHIHDDGPPMPPPPRG